MAEFTGILYRKAGGTTELNRSVGGFCAIESATLEDRWQDGGTIDLSVVMSGTMVFYDGDYVVVKGRPYEIRETISEYTAIDDTRNRYAIKLHYPDIRFKRAIMYNTVEQEDGGVFSWMRPNNTIVTEGSFQTLVETCCYNANEVANERVFKIGTINEDIETDFRVLSFSDTNCWATLKQICEEWNTFYTIRANTDVTPDSLYIIDFGAEPDPFPETISIGKNKGISELKLNYSDSDVYTQFIVLGSTENLPSAYPNERLQLDTDLEATPPVYDYSMIVANDKYAQWGRKRMELVYEYIKPTRTGTITGLPENNIFAFYDTDLATVLAEEPTWNPVGGTVHVVEGALLGYTFEIIGWHAATQKITIKQISDSNGLLLPNEDEPTFRFTDGTGGTAVTKYNLADIPLPTSYVTDARTRLKERAVTVGIPYWSQPRASFSLSVDPFFTRNKEVELSCGMLIPIVHQAMSINKSIRIKRISYNLLKDKYFDVESVEVSDIEQDNYMNSVHKDVQRTANTIKTAGYVTPGVTKQNNLTTLYNSIVSGYGFISYDDFIKWCANNQGIMIQALEGEVGSEELVHIINADLLRVNDAFANRILANEVFIGGVEEISGGGNAAESFAANLGYTANVEHGTTSAYAELQYQAAHSGTIIVGGYLRTSLIDANAVIANAALIGGVTISGTKLYTGTGEYGNANTPFYIEGNETYKRFSLGNKFTFDGTDLIINGSGTFSGTISVGTSPNIITIGKDAYDTGKHGIKLNAYNYWYIDGENAQVKFGGASTYVYWNGTALTQVGGTITNGALIGTSINVPDATTPLFKVTSAGVVTAKSGTIGGVTISATKIYLGTGTYGNANTPFYVDTSNQVSFGSKLKFTGGVLTIDGNGTFSGALSAATGSFTGSLSAATGSFAGSLDAVDGTFNGLVSVAGIKVGLEACGVGVDGLYINSNNYWDENGNFKAGGSASYIYWDGTTFAIKGDITGSTGTFSGIFAGSVEAGDAVFGVAAGGSGNDGLYINANNYWYDTGVFKAGSSTKYLYFDGTDATFTGILSAATGSFAGLIDAGGIKVGLAAGGSGVDGIYIDANNYWYDTGSLKIGSSTKYIAYSGGNLSMVGGSITSGSFATAIDDDDTSVSVSASASGGRAGVVLSGPSSNGAKIYYTGSYAAVSVYDSVNTLLMTNGEFLASKSGAIASIGVSSLGAQVFLSEGTGNSASLAYDDLYISGLPSTSQTSGHFWRDSNGIVRCGAQGLNFVIGTGSDTSTIYFSTT